MKKYILSAAAFMFIAAAASAQATPPKTTTGAKISKAGKPAAKRVSETTATVSPSTSSPVKKTSTDAAMIKRKHSKKHKSVKPVSK